MFYIYKDLLMLLCYVDTLKIVADSSHKWDKQFINVLYILILYI